MYFIIFVSEKIRDSTADFSIFVGDFVEGTSLFTYTRRLVCMMFKFVKAQSIEISGLTVVDWTGLSLH